MKSGFAAAVLMAGLAVPPSAAEGGSLSADVGGIRVELASEPARPGTRQPTIYRVRLAQGDGRPVSGMRLTLRGRMADGMTVLAPLAPAQEPGIYAGRVLFTMEGPWDLTLRIAGKGHTFELPLTEHVGR